MEPNLFDDNIDIFADLTVKPKEKSKKKVAAKSMFDDDTGECLSRSRHCLGAVCCQSCWSFPALCSPVGSPCC